MNQTADRTFLLRVIAAFVALYVIWGSTYLAIRVTLDSMSASASAAARFVIAGPFLVLLARLKGQAIVPPRRELMSLSIMPVAGGRQWPGEVRRPSGPHSG